MSNLVPPTAEQFMPIEFTPVPEFTPDDIPRIVEHMAAERRSRSPQIGANVIRNVSQEDLDRCLAEMAASYPPGYELKKIPFKRNRKEGDRPIHADREIGEITAHYTQGGTISVALLIGSRVKEAFRRARVESLRHVTDELFDEGLLNTKEVTPPTLALRTTVSDKDLLLFDHTKPHVFRTESDFRYSIAHYYTISQAALSSI